ncbi:MAG TPA: aromatic amino acid lyase, partial [Candidatus Wunengus sp. YC63]|uniref:aromatic amino acid lyase n=1 Tax=Candidatus Wunengus sp. YC63 TaxID=3367699 RepID=UPI00402501DA
MEYIVLNGENLSLDQFIQGVREKKQVMLSEEAEIKVIKARETIEKALKGKRVIYGLTTGFGALSDVVISK